MSASHPAPPEPMRWASRPVFAGTARDLQSTVSTDMGSRATGRRVIALDMGSVTPPKDHPDFGTLMIIQAFAIDTPGGVVLVDTGLGEAEPTIDAMYSPTRRSLAKALLEIGLSRERVSAIAASHLHFDHAGALPEFSGLPIHVQRDELQAARQPRYTVRSRVEGPALRYIEHAGDGEVCEGVRVIATRSHARPSVGRDRDRTWAGNPRLPGRVHSAGMDGAIVPAPGRSALGVG